MSDDDDDHLNKGKRGLLLLCLHERYHPPPTPHLHTTERNATEKCNQIKSSHFFYFLFLLFPSLCFWWGSRVRYALLLQLECDSREELEPPVLYCIHTVARYAIRRRPIRLLLCALHCTGRCSKVKYSFLRPAAYSLQVITSVNACTTLSYKLSN